MKALRAVLAGAMAAAAAAACFVDLDPPLGAVEPVPDTGLPDNTLKPSDVDAADTGAPPECVTETDCNPGNEPGVGCLSKACISNKCEYAVCGTTSIVCGDQHQACDRPTGKCVQSPLNFEAAHFTIPLPKELDGTFVFRCSSGGTSPTRCFAAVWPFLIVAQPTNPQGAVNAFAYDVSNPAAPSTTPIPINGVSFPSLAVVSNGRRVYFVDGSASNQRIAWLDVPSNPYVTSMTAQSIDVAYPASRTPTSAYPAPNGGLYIGGTGGFVGRFDPPTAPNPFPFNAVQGASGTPAVVDSERTYYFALDSGTLLVGNASNPSTNLAAFNGFADSGLQSVVQFTSAGAPSGVLANVTTTRDAGNDASKLDQVILGQITNTAATTPYVLETYPNTNVRAAAGNVVAVDGGAVALAVRADTLGTFATRVDFGDATQNVDLDIDAGQDAGVRDLYPMTSNGFIYIVHWVPKSFSLGVDILADGCSK